MSEDPYKRITTKRKCGCEYISERDPAVRKGYEMGGYLWKACPAHESTNKDTSHDG